MVKYSYFKIFIIQRQIINNVKKKNFAWNKYFLLKRLYVYYVKDSFLVLNKYLKDLKINSMQ